MTLIEEGQLECAHLLYKDNSCVGSNIANYRQLKRVSANSCVGWLNTEGRRDPASRLTQTANKRRERVTASLYPSANLKDNLCAAALCSIFVPSLHCMYDMHNYH